MSGAIASRTLPVKGDLNLAYVASLVIALGLAAVSAVGLGSDGLYPVGAPLVQVSRGGDATNLILGLPVLLGSMWLARRGSLIGLLLWPGALFYTLYACALYLLGAPFSGLFLGYVALVTLNAWTLIAIVASIDGEEVRRRLAAAPARGVSGALVAIAVLAYVGLTAAVLGALGSPAADAGMRPQWVVDFGLGTPVLLLAGVLLWRRASLGYVAAAGLLLVAGLNGLAFSTSAVFDGLLAGRSLEPAVVAVHLVIAGVSLALLVFFCRSATGRQPVGLLGTSSRDHLRRQSRRGQRGRRQGTARAGGGTTTTSKMIRSPTMRQPITDRHPSL
jgi:hypothetical protein